MVKTLLTAVVLVTLLPGGARAGGGWWTHIDFVGQEIASGDTVRASVGQAYFVTLQEAKEARASGGYAYLIEDLDPSIVDGAYDHVDFDPDWWRLGGATAHRAGTVSFSAGNANIPRTHMRLEVPLLEPGVYDLMFCDLGCNDPLGTFLPVPVRVVEDTEIARLYGELDRLESRVRSGLHRVREHSNEGMAGIQRSSGRLVQDVRDLKVAVHELRGVPDSLRQIDRRVDRLEQRPSMGLVTAGLLGIGLAAAGVVRRTKRRRGP
ncbi:MAG: hypothetical protein M3174_06425 [Actinomycetota bacterium]|nr:hypothetical protein [Actinomycetota bacterium]